MGLVNTIVEPEQLWAEVDQWIVDRCYRSCRSHPAVPKPIPRWDVHFGILKTTEETQRLVRSPLVATRVGTDSVVLRYVHFTLALV